MPRSLATWLSCWMLMSFSSTRSSVGARSCRCCAAALAAELSGALLALRAVLACRRSAAAGPGVRPAALAAGRACAAARLRLRRDRRSGCGAACGCGAIGVTCCGGCRVGGRGWPRRVGLRRLPLSAAVRSSASSARLVLRRRFCRGSGSSERSSPSVFSGWAFRRPFPRGITAAAVFVFEIACQISLAPRPVTAENGTVRCPTFLRDGAQAAMLFFLIQLIYLRGYHQVRNALILQPTLQFQILLHPPAPGIQ